MRWYLSSEMPARRITTRARRVVRPLAPRRTFTKRYGRRPLGLAAQIPNAVRAAAGVSAIAANAYKMRYRSGSETVNQPRRNGAPQPVEIAELTRTSLTRGRPLRQTLANLYRLTAPARQSVVMHYQAVNQFCTSSAGANKLAWMTDSTNNNTVLPMHVYDLSSFQNFTSSVTRGAAGLGAALVNAANTVELKNDPAWGFQYPSDKDGTIQADNTWQFENTPTTSSNANPWRSSFWKWISIKMLCYGRSTCPTRYNISIVQIPDESLNYGFLKDTGAVSSDKQLQGHLESVTAPFRFNPLITDGYKNATSKWKVLASKDFVLGSITSNEGSQGVPHMKEVKMFLRMNRLQKYDWKDSSYVTQTNLSSVGGGDDDYIQSALQMQTTPTPVARYFLVVRAQATGISKAGVPTYADYPILSCPSYDIVMRSCHDNVVS